MLNKVSFVKGPYWLRPELQKYTHLFAVGCKISDEAYCEITVKWRLLDISCVCGGREVWLYQSRLLLDINTAVTQLFLVSSLTLHNISSIYCFIK